MDSYSHGVNSVCIRRYHADLEKTQIPQIAKRRKRAVKTIRMINEGIYKKSHS